MKKKKILTVLIAVALIASCGVGLTAAVSAMRANQKDQPETVLQETLDLNLQEIIAGDSQQETAPMVEISGIAGDCAKWNFDPSTGTLSITGSGYLYYFDDSEAGFADNDLSFSSGYTGSAPWWDYRKQILKLEISDEIINIPDEAFLDCENLTAVTIPDSVELIGNSAFALCSSLETVSLGKDLREIGCAAFLGCGLTSITIPEKVWRIEYQAFSDCSALQKLIIEGNPQWFASTCTLAFENCPLLDKEEIIKAGYYDYNRNTANVAHRYEPMNDSELITDLRYGKYQTEDGTEYAYHVPQINFNTPDAERINQEIMEQYNQLNESGDWMLRWSVVRCKDIVGLIVECYDSQDNTVAQTYNFDPQGNEISDTDLLLLCGFDKSYFMEYAVRDCAQSFCVAKLPLLSERRHPLFETAYSISGDYAGEAELFMDPDYGLMMISKIGSLTGADSYEDTFPACCYIDMGYPGAYHAWAKALGASLGNLTTSMEGNIGNYKPYVATEDGAVIQNGPGGDSAAWDLREDVKTDSGLIIRLARVHEFMQKFLEADRNASIEEQAAAVYDTYLAGVCLTGPNSSAYDVPYYQINSLTVYNTENGAKRIQITANGVDMGTFELDNTIQPQFIQLDSEAIVANRPAELEITVLESYGSTVPLSEQLAEVHVGFTSNISGAR